MTAQEENHVRDVLKFFYPELSPVQTINGDLADLAALMLKEALEGSKAMDLVPRPPGFKPGVVWLISQAVQVFWRSQGRTRIYEAVRVTVARAHRSDYEIAKTGD